MLLLLWFGALSEIIKWLLDVRDILDRIINDIHLGFFILILEIVRKILETPPVKTYIGIIN